MEYDFSVLNDRDFEILACDLLGISFGHRIERFKAGRDRGVDGRWFSTNGEVIIQFKHWTRTGVDRLITHMLSEEKVKIKALNPSRYVLATSLPLSRDNKRRLTQGLAPFVRSESDIYGREDLHDLLISNPQIEGRHPKLWVTSANIISRLLNSGLIGRSGFTIEEIQARSRRYVDTEDAGRARKILETSRVIVIKGEPGVGKTTLAHQLMLEASVRGFSGLVVDSIDEAEEAFLEAEPQFFLYDDFLGSNFLEVIRGREDSKVVAFMRRVASKSNKRFVLTSRSHILEQGKDCSELFRIENIARKEFELNVGHLSKMERAQILYAHLWAGGLPGQVLDAMYEECRYLQVIKHRNYNPRIVSFITDPDRVSGLSAADYWNHVVNSLDHPSDIWSHVFRKQLSSDVRDLAMLVSFNGPPIYEEDLQGAFARRWGTDVMSANLATRFHNALRISLGSVLNRTVLPNGQSIVSLFNPSIRDYLLSDIAHLQALPEMLESLQTVSSLDFLDSLVKNGSISVHSKDALLRKLVTRDDFPGGFSKSYAVEVTERALRRKLLSIDDLKCSTVARFVTDGLEFSCRHAGLRVLNEALRGKRSRYLMDAVDMVINDAKDFLRDNETTLELCTLAKQADARFGGSRTEEVRQEILAEWADTVGERVADAAILSGLYASDDVHYGEEQVFNYIQNELRSFGVAFDDQEISDIAGEVDVHNAIINNAESDGDWDDERGEAPDVPDSAIVDYFGDRSNTTSN